MISKTDDYDKFKKNPSNRDLDENNLRKIINSIRTRNMLEFRPILVNSKMEVIDGQHRLEAAKRLGIPVFYQQQKEMEQIDILLLNVNQKSWVANDYLNYYISQKNDNYRQLFEFMQKNEINLQIALGLIFRTSSTMHLEYKKFKEGKFEFPMGADLESVNDLWFKIQSTIGVLREKIMGNKKHIGSIKMIQALISLFQNPRVDFEAFIKKLICNLDAVVPCGRVTQCYEIFKKIYNWRNQDPIE